MEYRRYRFTVAVVLDENLHRVGQAVPVDHSVRVIDLPTLFKMQVETLLVSLKGTPLRKEACHFLLRPTPSRVEEAYHKILALRDRLIRALLTWEKGQPVSEEARALRKSVKNFEE